ncbi:MAG: hypothetical protein HY683_10475 [Chloroflexi bacterium]|nr:hypothetical protein [Chloroflexota bacterium]
MRIFFDMDYTIVSTEGRLRPGVVEVFQRLREDGHSIYIWSGMGVRAGEVRYLGLEPMVSGVYRKPLIHYKEAVCKAVEQGEIGVMPDLVVDDYPEVVADFGGVAVKPYFFRNPEDREMERVYRVISELAANGHAPGSSSSTPGT